MSKAYVFLYAKTPQIFRKILMSSWRYVEIELRWKFAEQEKRVNAAMSVATIVEPTCVCRSWRFGGAGCKQPKWQHCHYNRKKYFLCLFFSSCPTCFAKQQFTYSNVDLTEKDPFRRMSLFAYFKFLWSG
jgi:hypothetical protein